MEQFFESLPHWANAAFFVAGCLLIIKCAEVFCDAAIRLAKATGIPRVVIGATVVSFATTAPEFCVSFIATILNRPQTAVGNVIGSCVANIGLILATVLVIRAVVVNRRIVREQGLFMLAAGVMMVVFGFDGTLERWTAIPILALMVGYLYYCYRAGARERVEASGASPAAEGEAVAPSASASMGVVREIKLVALGGLGVAGGSFLLVQNGAILARWFGVPELIVALTLVSVGTSLPEYVTAVVSTIKRAADLSVGNIIGADVLDIAWVIGSCVLVRPLSVEHQTRVLDLPFTLILMSLLVFFGGTRLRMERWQGGVLLGVYLAYLAIMFAVFA